MDRPIDLPADVRATLLDRVATRRAAQEAKEARERERLERRRRQVGAEGERLLAWARGVAAAGVIADDDRTKFLVTHHLGLRRYWAVDPDGTLVVVTSAGYGGGTLGFRAVDELLEALANAEIRVAARAIQDPQVLVTPPEIIIKEPLDPGESNVRRLG